MNRRIGEKAYLVKVREKAILPLLADGKYHQPWAFFPGVRAVLPSEDITEAGRSRRLSDKRSKLKRNRYANAALDEIGPLSYSLSEIMEIGEHEIVRWALGALLKRGIVEHDRTRGWRLVPKPSPADHENGKKCGVDDYLASEHTLSDLESLIEGPRPQPQPAPARTELLEDAPLTMRRPLALIDGRAYAAIWPHVRVTVTETLDKSGNVIKLNPPKMTKEQRLLILRDDGRLFGQGGDEPLADLGADVHLPEIPPAEKLWSVRGVNAYRVGSRPTPADVFQRLVEVVDRFIDFDRSLADQRTMSEMIACYILATWFLDAFTVIGFLWPNGDRGSGKTQLLLVVTELAYLGQTILAGGSYASLRDLADYGAALAFDDAENLSDPRRSDPDKRTLLLAGNRRGNTVSVKEPGPDRTWKTRHVNTFCARLFSAIRLPDEVLASRSIIVPLIRTIDRVKANADPLDYRLWPHDRRTLIDDLWSLALAHLPKLSHYETLVNDHAELTGRTLEPWRAILAVSLWLDDNGVKGLWARMSKLSQTYQQERPDFESSDFTRLVIQALVRWSETSITSNSSMASIKKGDSASCWLVKTKDITEAAKVVATENDLDFDAERITSKRVGRALGRLRIEKDPDTSTRAWRVREADLTRLRFSFGFTDSAPTGYSPLNAGNAGNAGNACPETPNGEDPEADRMAQEERRAIQEESEDIPVEFGEVSG